MDDRLKSALEQANYSVTVQNQKKNFQLRFANQLIYSVSGGTFTITQQLISFVNTLIGMGNIDAILIDDRGNPIAIADLQDFLVRIIEQYHQATNEFRASMEKLKRARSTTAAVTQ